MDNPEQLRRLKDRIKRDLGSEFVDLLGHRDTVEFMVNPDGSVWLEQLGRDMRNIGEMKSYSAHSIIQAVASFHNESVTSERPIVEGNFPLDDSRFAGILPPAVSRPTFAIRKKASAIYSLDDYVQQGSMTHSQKETVSNAVLLRKNILVAGSTGSGKTTFVNAVIAEMEKRTPAHRIVILEDTGEIQSSASNRVSQFACAGAGLSDLVRVTLRLRPDRIVVGEVRGAEALDLLDAWDTGHSGGAGTIHANSAQDVLHRLTALVSRHPRHPAKIEPMIGRVVDMIVFMKRTSEGRKVSEIVEVEKYSNDQFQLQELH